MLAIEAWQLETGEYRPGGPSCHISIRGDVNDLTVADIQTAFAKSLIHLQYYPKETPILYQNARQRWSMAQSRPLRLRTGSREAGCL